MVCEFHDSLQLKGVPVKMSGFVSALSVFPTCYKPFYTVLFSKELQSWLESSKFGYYPKLSAETVDLSSGDEKMNKAKPDNFTGTPFMFMRCYFIMFCNCLRISSCFAIVCEFHHVVQLFLYFTM